MATNNELMRQQAVSMRKFLIKKGYVSRRLRGMEEWVGESNPECSKLEEDIFKRFFKEGAILLNQIYNLTNQSPVDFKQIVKHVDLLKNCTVCVGSVPILTLSLDMRTSCKNSDQEGVNDLIMELIAQYSVLQKNITEYFDLLRRAGPVDAATRPQSPSHGDLKPAAAPRYIPIQGQRVKKIYVTRA